MAFSGWYSWKRQSLQWRVTTIIILIVSFRNQITFSYHFVKSVFKSLHVREKPFTCWYGIGHNGLYTLKPHDMKLIVSSDRCNAWFDSHFTYKKEKSYIGNKNIPSWVRVDYDNCLWLHVLISFMKAELLPLW